MFNLIKNIIGKLTLPDDTYYHVSTKEYWVKTSVSVPELDFGNPPSVTFTTYNWQQATQNEYGKWELKTSYVTNFNDNAPLIPVQS